MIIDFSQCPVVNITLGGAMSKLAVIYENEYYILKFDKNSRHSISEYVVKLLCNELGIACQEVKLGYFNGERVCALEYFLKSQETLHSYYDIQDSSMSLSNDKDVRELPYEIPLILDVLNSYKNLNITVEERIKCFWNMVYLDTLIGNFDRHWGNWGFIGKSKSYDRIAPMFDSGSSLFPKLIEGQLTVVLNSKDEMLKRVYEFPTSQIQNKGKKYKYKELIMDSLKYTNGDFLKDFCNRYDKSNLSNIFDDEILNSVASKDEIIFIKEVIQLRYKFLLKEII